MHSLKSILLLGSVFAPATIGIATPRHLPVTGSLPTDAKCFNIAYSKCEIEAAANQDIFLPVGAIQGFPMKYPLANLKYTNGVPFPASGGPWAKGCTDTSTLQKYPLVPRAITGTFANGTAKPWDGSTTRSSVVADELQSDFLFMNAEGDFCMIATETPGGMPGWLPCWFSEG